MKNDRVREFEWLDTRSWEMDRYEKQIKRDKEKYMWWKLDKLVEVMRLIKTGKLSQQCWDNLVGVIMLEFYIIMCI